MRINKYFENVEIVVINLKERIDKREYIQKELKSKNLKYTFYTATKNNDPKRGCLESHLQVIQNAIQKKVKYLLIIEDDLQFIENINTLKKPPTNWDMIYLGGTVHRIMDSNMVDNTIDNNYVRVQCWTTHGYIMNLTNQTFVNEIIKASEYEHEIDRYYLEKIHPKFYAYMCNPMIAIQKPGYSDIEGREVSYDFMQYTLQGLRVPEHTIDENGNYVLKLENSEIDDLPNVSIITPTYNRRKLFDIAIRNFQHFNYPKHKLEWIIVDDSICNDEIDESVKDLLPRDNRIKYMHFQREYPMTISMKRNICVSQSSYSYIVHMDDDDYYPPESILARIKILLKYKKNGIECVGSTLIGTYNILNNTSSMSSDGPISLSEASMAYTKKFWEERPFDELCIRGEHKYFTEQRLNKIIDIPYSFIIIAINHRNNFTDNLRSNTDKLLKFSSNDEVANYFDTWDSDTQDFINELRDYLLKK
jgi:GR25 family glycosyltransferase involved in LPS biosynthesis